MSAIIPPQTKFAAGLVGFLSISPFIVALDLAVQFLPDYPAIQSMRASSLLAKALWVAVGPLGIATALLLLRRPFTGFIATLLFSILSVVAGYLLWLQLRPFGIALLAGACVLAAVGARKSRPNAKG